MTLVHTINVWRNNEYAYEKYCYSKLGVWSETLCLGYKTLHKKKKRFSLSTWRKKTYLVPLRYFYAANRCFLALNQKGRLNISILRKSQLSRCRHTARFQKLKLQIEKPIRLARYSFSFYVYTWFIYINRTNRIDDDIDILFLL